eukprot:TRINITY_DN3199_c0_g2_i1.p2 TRINITY_DN3199_c0_g2~~TRINITY_DN3199_c0_g2_i1.p2  ORF type:complete len:190 (+),score=46.35 TRINITY_DN3199_c0_g2_i1:978-1547(+)
MIKHSFNLVQESTIEESVAPELTEARALVRRIRKRELYGFVDDFIVPETLLAEWQDPTSNDIIGYIDYPDITPEEILITSHTNNYALGDRNPVDHIYFFSKYDPDNVFTVQPEQISLMIPKNFLEREVRVYCKDNDPAKKYATQKGFREYLRQHWGSQPSPKHTYPEKPFSPIPDIDRSVIKKMFVENN